MKSTVLRKDFFELFASGGEEAEDIEPITQVRERKQASSANHDEEEDDDDDADEYITDAKDRRIRKLSRESNRRRIDNRDLRKANSEKDEEIAELRRELGKADKLQKNFNKLKGETEAQAAVVRKMAIRRAIESDKLEGGEKRAWYDVSMVESLLDESQLAVDLEDFSVGGLNEQLTAIAADKPFLVKTSESSNDKQESRTPAQPSGSAPQSSATGTQDQQRSNEEAEMFRNFPALGRN